MNTASFTLLITFLSSIFLTQAGQTFAQEDTLYAIQEIRDIAYYEGKSNSSNLQQLHLVIPRGLKNFPLLVWIGGGAWSYVDRNKEMDLARKFARQGIAVASVGHRLSPAAWKDPSLTKGIKHPEHITDVATAFKWLYDHAAEYGYTVNNLFIGGYSSGAHLAALLSADETYLKSVGLSTHTIRAVIPVAGTYDITHYYQVLSGAYGKQLADSHVKGVFGETEHDFMNASPTSYAGQLSVPMLLISESNTYSYTKVFEDKLQQTAFKKIQVVHIQEMDHSGLWKSLSFAGQSKYRQLIVDYIKNNTAL